MQMVLPPAPPFEEFAARMGERTASCHFIGEPSEFLTITQKKKFAILVVLHTFAPFAFVPLWAYHEGSWWFLLGIPAALFGLFLGSRASVQGSKATSGGFLPILLIALFFIEGSRSRDFFLTFCATWTWALYLIADNAQRRWATENLLSSAEVYDHAVASEKVLIIQRDQG